MHAYTFLIISRCPFLAHNYVDLSLPQETIFPERYCIYINNYKTQKKAMNQYCLWYK